MSQPLVLPGVVHLQLELGHLACLLFIEHLGSRAEVGSSPRLLPLIKEVLLNLHSERHTRYPRLKSMGGAENANYLSCMNAFLMEEVVGWSSSA
jgi:hypothetical protein